MQNRRISFYAQIFFTKIWARLLLSSFFLNFSILAVTPRQFLIFNVNKYMPTDDYFINKARFIKIRYI